MHAPTSSLREERVRVWLEQRALIDLAEMEGRELSDEEASRWQRLDAVYDDLTDRIAEAAGPGARAVALRDIDLLIGATR